MSDHSQLHICLIRNVKHDHSNNGLRVIFSHLNILRGAAVTATFLADYGWFRNVNFEHRANISTERPGGDFPYLSYKMT